MVHVFTREDIIPKRQKQPKFLSMSIDEHTKFQEMRNDSKNIYFKKPSDVPS